MQKLILKFISLGFLVVLASPNFDDDDYVSESIKKIFGKPDQYSKTTRPNKMMEHKNEMASSKRESDVKCSIYNGSEGVCVPYNMCNNQIMADGVQIRFQEVKCPSPLDVCCILSQTLQDSPPPAPLSLSQRITQIKRCGIRNPGGVGSRSTRGENTDVAEYGEFPWMVAVVTNIPGSEDYPEGEQVSAYICGGSLIHPSVVLTAAHYVSSHKILSVKAGEVEANDESKAKSYPSQERDVSSIVIHKNFDSINLYYDIAVLFLALPMEMAPNVGLVCLPPPLKRTPGGTHCLGTGWGKDKFGEDGYFQVTLKRLDLPVVDRSKCQLALRKTRLGHFFQLHPTFMCAIGEIGKDTCTGDGGSPLVCPIEKERDRYMQSGIVAWGIGCGADGSPGVYVDVSQLRDWIDDTVAGKGLDTSVYSYDED